MTSDAMRIGNCLDITARATGSIVALVAVAVVLLETETDPVKSDAASQILNTAGREAAEHRTLSP